MYLKFGRVRVHVTFAFALFTAFAASSAAGERLALTFASALLHECVHLVFLTGFGCTGIKLTLNPGGAAISCAGTELLPETKQLAALLSAPSVNIIAGVLLAVIGNALSAPELKTAANINLWLGGVNLLPLGFLDGGRALNAALGMKYRADTVRKITQFCDILSAVLLTAVTVFLIFIRRAPDGAVFFALYCLVFSLFLKK